MNHKGKLAKCVTTVVPYYQFGEYWDIDVCKLEGIYITTQLVVSYNTAVYVFSFLLSAQSVHVSTVVFHT